MAGFASRLQEDWGAGIFRGRNAPRGSVYDAVNALVNDERELFKRGGTTYATAAVAPAALSSIAEVAVAGGTRRIVWSDTSSAVGLTVESGGVLTQIRSVALKALSRPARVGAYVVLPSAAETSWLLYAGSMKDESVVYTTGTINVTEGSPVVIGAGTAWLANIDAGMFVGVGAVSGIVQSVDNDGQITLREPWPGATAAGTAYSVVSSMLVVNSELLAAPTFVTAVAGQLIVAHGTRAYMVARDLTELNLDATAYHEVPFPIIGAEGIGSTLVLFTTGGVWTVANMDLDALDDAGNVQHTVDQLSKDIVLWGDAGVVGWAGALLVPAIDDVVVMATGMAPVPVSEAIRPLYRGYVKAGLKPGLASVHRGHYFLPILDSSNVVVDVLVCRLDLRDRNGMRPAWTRWSGHAACPAYAVSVGTSLRQPKLVAVNGLRIAELSDCFNVPGTATDADATTPSFTVDTQDFAVGQGMRDSYVDRVRVEYEMAGAGSPAVTLGWADGAEGSAFTTVTAVRGGGVSDGSDYSVWRIGKTRDRIRFRIQSTSAVARLILRRLEVLVRPNGRQ